MRGGRARRIYPALLALLLALAGCANTPPETRAPGGDYIRFEGRNGVATAHGIFHTWRIVEARVERGDPAASFVEIEVDVASLDTGIDARDEHLRDPDFFEVERWPKARIRVSDVREDGEASRSYRARFDVEIRDHRESIDGRFAIVQDDPPVVEGEVVLDRVAFGVGTPDRWWNPFSPRDQIPVRFRATLD